MSTSNSENPKNEGWGCFSWLLSFIILFVLAFVFAHLYEKSDNVIFLILFIFLFISSVIVPLVLYRCANPYTVLKIFITICVCLIVLGYIISAVNHSLSLQHECEFESLGHSTTTCQHLGTTVYECYYKESLGCKKIKVVQDTQYAECSYFQEVVSDKIDITIVKNTCRNCGNVYIEAVKNSYGTWGDHKIRDNGRSGNTFRAILFHEENPPDLYAVLYFFDKDGNKIGYWYSHELLLSYHRDTYLVKAYLENELPSDYYEHRWDLQSYKKIGEPNTFIPVK